VEQHRNLLWGLRRSRVARTPAARRPSGRARSGAGDRSGEGEIAVGAPEQRTVIDAMQRALDYAHRHGVTLVSAAGNGATDYTKTIIDASSPDFASEPGEAPYERTISPSCISMPSEGNHVLSISSIGISKRKAYYSDYGNGYVDLSAPGGDVYDTADNKRDITKAILAAYPKHLAEENGQLNPDGTPNTPNVVRDCRGAPARTTSTCRARRWRHRTRPASRHWPSAAGV
jgi:Subtilase family